MRLPLLERRAGTRFRYGAVTIAIASLILLSGAAWLLASAFQSPQQREADAAPPDSKPIFGTVEQGSLSDDIVLQGTVASSSEHPLTLPADAGAPRSVITGAPVAVGGEKSSGELLTEVNGRPVFVAESPFEFYRDMAFGDVGPDVRQLQIALVEAGHLGYADGRFGPQTARAVAELYTEAGYSVPRRIRPAAAAEGAAAPISDPYMPIAELAAITDSPALVIDGIDVGERVGDPEAADLVLGSTSVLVRIEIAGSPPEGVVEDTPATIRIDGSELPGAIGRVSSSTVDGAEMTTTTATFSERQPQVARGSDATVVVTRSVVADDALLLPVSAVVDRGDGKGVVVKRQADGTLIEVPVRIIGSLRGIVAVQATGSVELSADDRVRVG